MTVDVMDPAHRHVPLCPFHAATGWWCPLCGGLRAAQALSHADVKTALHDNVLLVAAVPVLGWIWLAWFVRARPETPPALRSRPVGAMLVVVLIVFTVVRNLPWAGVLRL